MVWFWIEYFPTGFQEAHKLLQPVDKTLKTMAIEFAEFQVYSNFISLECDKGFMIISANRQVLLGIVASENKYQG